MADQESQNIEPEDSGSGTSAPPPKGRPAFRKLRRELNDDELASPAVQRMLIDDLESLAEESSKLKEYQDKYHTADKQAAVLEEKLKERVSQDIVFGVCLTVGAAALGYAPTIWDTKEPSGWFAIAFGVILIVSGIASKVVKR